MANPVSRRSSIASRHNVRRQSSRLSTSSSLVDIFSDDNAIEFDPVVDGYRPGAGHEVPTALIPPTRPITLTPTPQPPPRAASPPRVTEYLKKRIAGQEGRSASLHRSSLSTSRRESQISQRVPSVSVASDTTARPLSTVSGLSTPVSESPYMVSSGPSHPYALYPQASSLNRSTSTSTTNTQHRPYNGPSQPAHPYGLYPQIPGSAAETDPFADSADIANVGFPGLGQRYARRLGPEGEEAEDLIGPDGHTEQLPPYSRYPAEASSKTRGGLTEEAAPLVPASSRSPAESLQTGSLPESELEPDTSSATTLLNNESGTRVNEVAAREVGDEELNRREKWKTKGKQRTCWGRIPIWAWVVFVLILCALAATLGGVVGKYVGHHNVSSSNRTGTSTANHATTAKANNGISPTAVQSTVWQTVTTTLIDATPLATTPYNLPALPTGSFALPIGAPNFSSNGCIPNSGQKVAWSCSSQAYMSLNVDEHDSVSNVYLYAEYPKEYPLFYGPQAPMMHGPAAVTLMDDLDNMNSGPAYYFQQLYNKLVIVPGSQLTADTSARRRLKARHDHHNDEADILGRSRDDIQEFSELDELDDVPPELEVEEAITFDINEELKRRDNTGWPQPVATGDTLWFCFWNGTILEGFIYANRNSSPAASETSYIDSVAASTLMTDAPLTASAAAAAAATMSATPAHKQKRDSPYSSSATPTVASSHPSHTPPVMYPRAIKLEERRSLGMVQPYCQQMNAQQDGTIVMSRDAGGNPIMFNLTEKEPIVQHNILPSPGATAGGGGWWSKRFFLVRDGSTQAAGPPACSCQWNCT